MSNKVIIAAAGSGKTRHLVKEALRCPSNRVLITTYTDKNTEEIKNRIIEESHCLPCNITVMPWYSFLLTHGVRPYQGAVYSERRISNLTMVNQQSATWAKEENFCKHYLTKEGKIYSDKIAKLACRIDQKTNGLVISRLSCIYTHLFIDEVQDLAGYDLDFIDLLLKSEINVLLVGDHRQGTFSTNKSNKNKQFRQERINDYFAKHSRKGLIEYDDSTLNTNYRCVPDICNFANSIFPEYTPCLSGNRDEVDHLGVYIVRKEDVDEYLDRYKPVQLRYSVSTHTSNKCPALNFGVSKGQLFDRVLIYPTVQMVQWILNGAELKPETRSKFYVAVTRARYSVGIVYTPKKKDIINIPVYEEGTGNDTQEIIEEELFKL